MLRLNNKGQSLVMFIILLPILLLILTLVYDVGNAIYEKDRLSNTNYMLVDYALDNIDSIDEEDLNTLILENDNNLDDISIMIIDNSVDISLKKNIKGVFGKMFNFNLTFVKCEYNGKIVNGKKKIGLSDIMTGKVISVFSVKGGVGKTTMTLNLAGIYCSMGKRVLIIDMDLYSGGIAVSLNINNDKDIFMMVDSMSNNRFTKFRDYITTYNSNIDVLACPRDPREASKIPSKFIPVIFDMVKHEYDVILVDTSHILDEINLTVLDNSYMSLLIVTNDLIDLKNTKSLISIFKNTGKSNYLTLLNSSRDTGRDYMSLYDIRTSIKGNIDYTISSSYYIKNIDKYVMNGEILTLNKSINAFHQKDVSNMKKLAIDLIDDRHGKEEK